MSGPTSRVITKVPYPSSANTRVISQCKIFEDIKNAATQYGPRLTFNISGPEIIEILSNQPDSPDLQKLIDKLLKIAENKVDKRGIDKQREIREKYQPTHGLILKNIPVTVQRQVVYDAIIKLGGMKNTDINKLNSSSVSPHFPPSKSLFDGELKMRSFQVPAAKKGRSLQNAFPIFVTQSDRDQLLEMAEKNNGEIRLPVVSNRDYGFDKKQWDGVVYVERVKNGGNQHSRSSSSYCASEHESDYQSINRSSFDNNDAFSSVSFGSSNRLFQTPNPCVTPNPLIYTPNPLTPSPQQLNIVTTTQVPVFSQPPSPYSTSSLPSPMILAHPPHLQNYMPPSPNFNQPAAQNFATSQNQINPRLLQNAPKPNNTDNVCSGVKFVRDHGDSIVQKQQKAQIEKIRATEEQADID